MINDKFNRRIIVNPEYIQQDITEYQSNPLIECLPPILSAKEVIDKTFMRPEVPRDIQYISPERRFHMMNRIKKAFYPGMETIEIERYVSSMIRTGYTLKNPLNMMDNYGVLKVLNQVIETQGMNHYFDSQYCDYSNDEANCETYSIIGYPGMGKTTTVKKIMGTYPSIVVHKEYNGRTLSLIQIPILKIECPSNGVKGFCLNFFSALDILLKNTNYARTFGSKRNSADFMLKQIEILSAQHHIGLLVVDEIQHLASSGSESTAIMNFFVSLTNVIHIPILFVGTLSALKVFGKDLRIARRVGTEGVYYWNRMLYLDEQNMPDRKWNSFMKFIWKFQYLNYPVEFNQEFSKLMYRHSQGISAIAIALFVLTQRRALENEERIEPQLIKEVADKQLKAVKPMINALATGSKKELEKYQDIKISIDSLVNSAPNPNESITVNYNSNQDSCDSKKQVKDKPRSKPVRKSTKLMDKKDLRYIFQQAQHNKKDLDVAFKEAGYLRELSEKLVI